MLPQKAGKSICGKKLFRIRAANFKEILILLRNLAIAKCHLCFVDVLHGNKHR
jgi:hypothetical protein